MFATQQIDLKMYNVEIRTGRVFQNGTHVISSARESIPLYFDPCLQIQSYVVKAPTTLVVRSLTFTWNECIQNYLCLF